ncbi:MAG: 4Fe-4S dicluster domain-containing protein [Eubacterium sp.]|nr:4Fe-4S dicluster domain-containing protein [Eubacterium sp.]
MDTLIKVNVNLIDINVKKGATILEAVRDANFSFLDMKIPTLYYLKGVVDVDDSGVCVVEADGELVNASRTRIKEGMKIQTRSEAVVAARKEALEKILKIHNKACIHCFRTGNCELQDLLHEYGFRDEEDLPQKDIELLDTSSKVLVRDNNKCIRCKRCINVCAKMQAVSAIAATGEGLNTVIAPASSKGLAAASCVNCGQCVAVCPTGALVEKEHTDLVKEALDDPDKFVVVQVAPAVRAAIGENFDFNIGNDVRGRLAGVLRDLGFDKVFDTKFGADLTIMEEANELVERIKNDGVLPMITSCCPGWVKYAEHFYPDMLDNISSCKSPHTMFGAVIKSYLAEKMGLDKNKIVVVSVMPCTAKKFEITRDDECGAGVPDVDIVITTNELAKMIQDAELKFESYSATEKYDEPFGEGTGAGVIFGATGGVMEAALRTAVKTLTGEEAEAIGFTEVRGMNGIKEASYKVAGNTIKVAVASGLANANALLTKIKNGEADYQFVEIMACPGGCVNGGGQPHQNAHVRAMNDVPGKRAAALYTHDEKSALRRSHEDPAITELYKNYLGQPGSEKAHELLHTTYVMR